MNDKLDAAGVWDIYVEQGADWIREVQYLDSNGDPVDCTGWSGLAQIRKTAKDPVVLASISVTFPSAGIVRFALTDAQTLSLPTTGRTYADIESYAWDCLLTPTGSSETFRFLNGVCRVSPGTSRS